MGNKPVIEAILILLVIGIGGTPALATGNGSAPEPTIPLEKSIRENLQEVEAFRNRAEYDRGIELARESLRLAEEAGNDRLITESLYQLSLLYYLLEDFEEAWTYMEIGLTHARLHGLKDLEGDLLNAEGVLAWKQGNLFEASDKLKQALKIKQEQNQRVSMASISNNLGIIAYSQKQYKKAVGHYLQGIEWLGDADNDRMRSSLFSNLGESLIPLNRYAEAETYLRKSLAIEREANNPRNLAYTYFNLGELEAAQGDRGAAVELYRKALSIQEGIDDAWAAALTRLRISREHLASGDHAAAIEVLVPGYEAVKRLNALTLLRDYAERFTRIYKATGDSGMARYYEDLHTWFIERSGTETPALESGDSQPQPEAGNVVAFNSRTEQPKVSFVRIATIGLLAILILVLVFENMRLRKLSKGD